MPSPDDQQTDTPVAIIGMAARAAGAPDVNALWQLVEPGHSAFADIPADRLPGFDAGQLGAQPPRAGLLDRIDTFDAEFFEKHSRDSIVTILTKGKDEDMKSFKGKLSHEQMEAVADYIKLFGQKEK